MKPNWFAPVPAQEVPAAVVRLAEARSRVLRLLRALEHIGVDPRNDPPLRHPLVKLVECDVVLLGNLARMRGAGSRHLAALVPRLLEIARDKRERTKQALPADRYHLLLPALGRVAHSIEDTLADADAITLDGEVPSLGGTPLPLDDVSAAHLAAHGWGTALPWPWHLGTSRP